MYLGVCRIGIRACRCRLATSLSLTGSALLCGFCMGGCRCEIFIGDGFAHGPRLRGITRAIDFAKGCDKAGLVLRKVCGVDTDYDTGIGIALIARILAHAIGHYAACFTGGSDHGAARAHTKAIDTASVGSMVHQFVIRSAQQRVTGMAAPACSVYHALRMLNAKADRKSLGLHRHAPVKQHGKSIARAMAQRHHHMAGCDGVHTARGRVADMQGVHALHTVWVACCAAQLHIHHLLPEAHFTA